MHKLLLLSVVSGLGLSTVAGFTDSENDESPSKKSQTSQKESFRDLVMEGLKFLEDLAPDIHRDALRVLKKYKKPTGAHPMHYDYRFWGARLVLWMQNEKRVVFDSAEKVSEVFDVLHSEEIISGDAAVILAQFAWSYLHNINGFTAPPQKKPKEHGPDVKNPLKRGKDDHGSNERSI